MNKRLPHFLWGIFFIILAFFTGSQPNATLGLFGFLGFFVVGVTLFIEGSRKQKKP